MVCKHLVVSGAVLLMSASAAGAQSRWQPVGTWGYDTARERCAAAHGYASGRKRVIFTLTHHPMSDAHRIMIEAATKPHGIEIRAATVDFGGGGAETPVMLTSSSRKEHTLYQIGASRAELDQLVASQRLTVSAPKLRAVLPIAGLGPVLRSLDECVSGLLAKWGLSKAEQARIARFPEPAVSLAAFFDPDDYPLSALERRAIGGVEVRVTVHPDGSASDCRIVRSSGHADIDQTTCQKAAGVRFKPAVDRNGRAMISSFLLQVRWLLAD